MAQVKISELDTLAQQLQNSDYVPVIHSGVTYKFAPFNYLVKNSGDETIAGIKTFSSSPIVPAGDSASEAVNYGQVVKNSGDETIAGVKTFSSSPIIPAGDSSNEAVNYGQVVKNSGDETISGVKTFSSTPIMTIQGGSAAAVKDTIQGRYDTTDNWASANPVLAVNEKGLETDTGKEKTGDGITAWNSLPYYSKVTSASLTASGITPTGGTCTLKQRGDTLVFHIDNSISATTLSRGVLLYTFTGLPTGFSGTRRTNGTVVATPAYISVAYDVNISSDGTGNIQLASNNGSTEPITSAGGIYGDGSWVLI